MTRPTVMTDTSDVQSAPLTAAATALLDLADSIPTNEPATRADRLSFAIQALTATARMQNRVHVHEILHGVADTVGILIARAPADMQPAVADAFARAVRQSATRAGGAFALDRTAKRRPA